MLADGPMRERMGDAAARRASLFSADVVVPQFEDAYRAAVETRRAKGKSFRRSS
jgi:hypothetical protein